MKILILLLISCSLWATEKHPIYNQILRNKPSINKQYAMKLSNIIHKMTRKYNLPSQIFTAILAQESGYRLAAKSGGMAYIDDIASFDSKVQACLNLSVDLGKECCVCKIKRYKKVKVVMDFGISQIHINTIERFDFNILKLTTDLEYSVEAGAIVLAGFKKKYSKREELWFTRYNSSNKIKRDIYYELIKRYF